MKDNDVNGQAATGGLFMAGIPGAELDDSTERLIGSCRINNFILFRRNVESPEQLQRLCENVVECCRRHGLARPIIAIDQEGGTVTRLPAPFTQFPDMRTLADGEDAETSLARYARICAAELKQLGVNLNLAPVLDVSPASHGYFMERRSLGGNPARVAELGALVIRELQQAGIAACGKHFPGLGRAVLDPHMQLPVLSNEGAAALSEGLLPFRASVKAEVAALMTCHAVYPGLDAVQPATLSGPILTGLLREEMGFPGVIITDDLEMGAIENHRDVASAAVEAFTAGADLLLICHNHGKVIAAAEKMSAALAAGAVSPERVAASLARLDHLRRIFCF